MDERFGASPVKQVDGDVSGFAPAAQVAFITLPGMKFMYIVTELLAPIPLGKFTHTGVVAEIGAPLAFPSTHAWRTVPVAPAPVVNSTLLQLLLM